MYSVNTLWLKTWRDLWLYKGRSVLVVLSIAVSTFTLGVILNSYSILSREMQESFQRANPTAITFILQAPFTQALIKDVKQYEGVSEVDARGVVSGNIVNQAGERYPLRLFVHHDFERIQLDIITPVVGAWPPKKGQILIEQQALTVLNGLVGEEVDISISNGPGGKLQLAGTVHDVVQAQAEWENVVYGYISLETLEQMGSAPTFIQLKLGIKEKGLNQLKMESRGLEIKKQLEGKGYKISGMQVPVPGEHPHANITNGMFMIQKVFAILCCFLSAILVFNLMSAILLKHISQIGLMKAVGAQAKHIRKIYYRGVLILGLLGMLLSMLPSYYVAKVYSNMIAQMMNITIISYQVPLWVMSIQIVLGLCIPLVAVLVPIRRAAKITIREAFLDYSGSEVFTEGSRLQRALFSWFKLSGVTRLALRNIYRRKARFLLTCAVLSIGAGLFITTYHVSETMHQAVADERNSKQWDLALQFSKPYLGNTLVKAFSALENVKLVETFIQSSALMLSENSGSELKVFLMQLNKDTKAFKPKQLSGQWLNASGEGVIVSQLVMKKYPGLSIGNNIRIKHHGKTKNYKLEGVVEVFGEPTVFLRKNNANTANALFISSHSGDANALYQSVIKIAEKENLLIKRRVSADEAMHVIEDHFEIIFSLMMSLTVIIIFIAGNGIILTITTNTFERTREIGVLKAIGASSSHLFRMIMTESIAMAGLSWLFACFLSIPFSFLVTYFLGVLLINSPLTMVLDMHALFWALPVVIFVCVVSVLLPIKRISCFPVKDALVYE